MPDKATIRAELMGAKILTIKQLKDTQDGKQKFMAADYDELQTKLTSLFFLPLQNLYDDDKYEVVATARKKDSRVQVFASVADTKIDAFRKHMRTESFWTDSDDIENFPDCFAKFARHIQSNAEKLFVCMRMKDGSYKYSYDRFVSIEFLTRCLQRGGIVPERLS